ncbi:hypothetical protein LCGC14_0741470, partial [marine sediment metagenome]
MGIEKYLPKLKLVKPIGGFHGVSAIFPTLIDVIDYEENNVIINHGYPRFVTHPIVKIIENKYKKKFGAIGAISCHSYEAALFLVIDYFFRRGNKIYFDKGIPLEFYNMLNAKFPNLVKRSEMADANILFIKTQGEKFLNDKKGKTVIGVLEDNNLEEDVKNLGFNIILCHDKKHDIGVILIFSIRYAMLDILRRHCGFNVSSRKIVKKIRSSSELTKKKEYNLRERIAELEKTSPEFCFLYPSGMVAIFSSILSLLSSKRGKIIAVGSLYVDTLRILESWPKKYDLPKPVFIRDNFIENLKNCIDLNTAGVIVEIPSNPLIQLVDIGEIVRISHSKGVKVIVDNTVATPYNFNPFLYDVDIVVHSTTKFLSGKNNHIGGVLLLPGEELKERIETFNKITKLKMHFNDIKVLSRNIRRFEERMEKINKNSEIVANFLNNHKLIKKVYYPSLKNDPYHLLMRKYLKGGSGLLSFVLKESTEDNAKKFYDNLLPPILKGPSLGSEKTLLCPYVIMAHYNDSKEELEQLGLDFYLMRISVGIEPVGKIIRSLENGLKNLE